MGLKIARQRRCQTAIQVRRRRECSISARSLRTSRAPSAADCGVRAVTERGRLAVYRAPLASLVRALCVRSRGLEPHPSGGRSGTALSLNTPGAAYRSWFEMSLARREFVRGPQEYLRLLQCVRVARRQATALVWGRGRTKRRVSLLSGVPRDPAPAPCRLRTESRRRRLCHSTNLKRASPRPVRNIPRPGPSPRRS